MNHYRSSAYALNCWIAVTALVGVVLKSEGKGEASVVGIDVSIWIILLVLGGGLIILVTLMIHASRLKVPLSKLLGKIVSDSKREGERERRETALRKLRESQAMGGGPMGQQKGSVVIANPLSQSESAGQRLHALTMDIELAAFDIGGGGGEGGKKDGKKTSVIKTENPLRLSVGDGPGPLAGEEEAEAGGGPPPPGERLNPVAEAGVGEGEKEGAKGERENPLADGGL